MIATPADVRRARAFLHERGVPFESVAPRRFATASKELGRTFADLLSLIMRLQAGGQGMGQAPIAERIAMEKR